METSSKLSNLDIQNRSEGVSYCEKPDQDIQSGKAVVATRGNHEVEMCDGEEADIPIRVNGCTKNPGHKGFIPLKDFNTNCLPSRYHDDDLMCKTIKTLAALTVQVKTKFTSLERPEFYPDTEDPFPFYKYRGSHLIRSGTGTVFNVYKNTKKDGTCRCAKCQVSATPSKVWGKVYVLTTKHVVFDDSEARQTKCVLGFDDNKSPVVSLDGWEVWAKSGIETDRCRLCYVTCDLELVDELYKMCHLFNDLHKEVADKYRKFYDVDKLTVIVSHPHGLPKQVSVGQWTHIQKYGEFRSRFLYTTCTCPGSSGAFVFKMIFDRFFHDHPHSGTKTMLNFSAESID